MSAIPSTRLCRKNLVTGKVTDLGAISDANELAKDFNREHRESATRNGKEPTYRWFVKENKKQ